MNKNKFWTLRYALINISYFAGFCTIHAYAAVYLLSKGFNNTQIGILLATANILSAVLQPVVAGIIDKPGAITNRIVMIISELIILIGSVLLFFVDNSIVAIFIIYALIYMVQFVYQPVMTALYFEYADAGANIMYGLARGLGSAGFATLSAFMGRAVEDKGVDVLLYTTIILMVISLVLIITFIKPDKVKQSVEGNASKEEADLEAHNSIVEFVKLYPMFALFIIASVCFFFAHNMINDYLIQIIRNVGGSESEMGYATFLAAILELPVMASITKIMKKFSPTKLLIISGIFFFVKTAILVFATSIAAVYVSQACQMLAYAVFIPASAYYVNQTMEVLDQVKGQAYISSAITFGGVFSSLVCGRVLDSMGPKKMLIIGCVVCLVGVVIAFVALGNSNTRKIAD